MKYLVTWRRWIEGIDPKDVATTAKAILLDSGINNLGLDVISYTGPSRIYDTFKVNVSPGNIATARQV